MHIANVLKNYRIIFSFSSYEFKTSIIIFTTCFIIYFLSAIIQFLGYVVFRCQSFDDQSFVVEEDWIMEMCRGMNSDRLKKLSIILEGMAFNRA